MRLLIDTHVLFWWLMKRGQISASALAAIEAESNEVYVSVASLWEMAIKVGLGKWPEAAALVDNFENEAADENFRIVPISSAHVRAAGLTQSPHRDPFDRLLAAQAQIEGLTLVTADTRLSGLGVPVLW